MEQLPATVLQRLRELAERFERELPDRIREIRGLSDQAEGGRVESLRELRLRIHRLAGSAATFGYDRVTELAREAERCIERDLTSESQRIQADTLELLSSVRHESEHLPGVDERVTGESAPTLEPARMSPRRLLLSLGEGASPDTEMAQQLAVFGVASLDVAEPADATAHLREHLGGGEVEFAILLSTATYFWGSTERLAALQELLSEFSGRLLLFLVGDEGDFDGRLRAVRLGADAFLPAPLELGSLLDVVEKKTGEAEKAPYHVMVIDDDPDQVSATALILQNAGMVTSVVTEPRSVFQFLIEQKPELILLDMYMPELSGPELASIIRQNEGFVSIPIVFLSVETNAERQAEAIAHGADDFLVKPVDPGRLVAAVRARASRTRAMRHFMERDSLTGLLNHTNLKQRLDHEVQRAARMGTELVFAMIDIDHFKKVNDTWGHLTGDRVIKSLARMLSERLRRTDIVGRYGGEEFAAILFNTDLSQAQRILNELRESFALIRHVTGDESFTVSFSCGLAEYPGFETPAALNEAADGALYAAKQQGRNRVISARL